MLAYLERAGHRAHLANNGQEAVEASTWFSRVLLSAILEYVLPIDERRPDVVLLVNGAVLVLELKTRGDIDLADLDQASAYARDLRGYHRDCADIPVHPFLVLMAARGDLGDRAEDAASWAQTPWMRQPGTWRSLDERWSRWTDFLSTPPIVRFQRSWRPQEN